MTTRRRRRPLAILLAVALTGGALYLGARRLSPCGDDDDDQALVYDRTWMTEVPERETDFLHAFIVLEEHPYGAFYRASSWRMEQEVFRYEADDRAFRIRFPQSGRRAAFRTTVRRCDDHPPFDLCLSLDNNPWDGPLAYYGFVDEEDESARRRGLGRLRAAMAPLLEQR